MAEARLWFASALLPNGWADGVRLGLSDGRIASVDIGVASEAGDSRHALALPGLPNLHSHAFQRAMAGLTEVRGPAGDSFWTWRELMYRFVERLTPQDVEVVAAMAFMEMLESGFTCVGEFHYLHHDSDGRAFANPAEMSERIVAAAAETGIGLTLLPVFYAHAGFGGAQPSGGQRRFINTIDSYANLLETTRVSISTLPDGRIGIAPHSLRAVTEAELSALTAAAAEPIHIHIAEQIWEVEDCVAWSGARPVEWLLDRFPVDPRWCLVHATHMTPGETTRLAQSGAVAGLCPITEANLGDGVFPAEAFLTAGGAFGVGSDSNVRIDASEELRLLEYGQRLTRRARNVLASEGGRSTGADLYRGAVAGGAQALGRDATGLVPGAAADIVSLKADHPDLCGRRGDQQIDSWVFAGGSQMVDCVWRFGRQVVAQGRHQGRDVIVPRYRAVMERLLR
ncbi:formimidoylglutamate deiminase [Phenylobacterium sp.]|uniref:formimidoylglutamate deiminase n=1 Tax=Phenylobacterium sp. TaxID=1871053 RepID=UPI003982F510